MQLYPLSVSLLLAANAWAQSTSSAESSTSASRSATSSGSGSGSLSASSTLSASASSFPTLTPYSDLNNCLLGSIGDAGCASVVDVNCFCTSSSSFTGEYLDCLTSNCSADELDDAEGLAEEFCALASPSTSLSFSSVTMSTTSSSAPTHSSGGSSHSSTSSSTSTSASSSASDEPSNAAVARGALMGSSALMALCCSGLGVLLGGVYTLL
ncbi:hypothetical protein BD626DRAFT_271233 [Schizophyllum amplum]|uniref:CFEM domain-containing protein n=1 Tax=Schizophyllum amplum TaxID=97359 RepID=A0A550CF05_9AGAR|nr:hypothetical protein BD626DRAFT_271233 [Auriculariopsis ampla]